MPARSLDDVIPLHVADIPLPELPREHPLAHLVGQVGAVLAFAVARSDGIILFETGIGRPHFPTVSSRFGAQLLSSRNAVERPIDVELERHGLRIADVRAVVNSHLHWDHCGGNPLFPGVPIYVQAAEYHAARQGGRYYTVPEWVDFPGVEFAVIDGDTSIGPGVTIISTPGHTPGHQSLVVESEDGPVALVGQAIYLRDEYEDIVRGGTAYGGGVDAEKTLASARRIIKTRPRRVHFSHDRSVWVDDR